MDPAAAGRAEGRALLAASRALIDSRRGFVEDQVAELSQLQGRNQKLVDTLGRKAADERKRIEEARTALVGLRAVHNRLDDDLAGLPVPNRARHETIHALAKRGIACEKFVQPMELFKDRLTLLLLIENAVPQGHRHELLLA